MTDSGIKLDFRTKSAAKFLCVKTFSGKVAKHSLAYLSAHQWLLDDAPLHGNFVCHVKHPWYGSGAAERTNALRKYVAYSICIAIIIMQYEIYINAY